MQRGYESDLTPFLSLIQAPTLLVINTATIPSSPLEEAIYLAEHIPSAQAQ